MPEGRVGADLGARDVARALDALAETDEATDAQLLANQPEKADRMTRNKTNNISVRDSCETIMNPPSPLVRGRGETLCRVRETHRARRSHSQALRLAALLMRGVVALYSRKVRFLHEDSLRALSRLNALAAPARADRNLLDKTEGARDARANVTVAYDGDILARPDFERVNISQAFDSQAFHVAASEQLAQMFDDTTDYDRFTARGDDQINLLEFQMPMDEEQARIEEEYEYEFAMGDEQGRRIDAEDDYAYMEYRGARLEDQIEEQMPLAAEDEEPIEEEPIGTQIKRMREQQAEADRLMALPQPKAKRQRTTMARSRGQFVVFDNETRIGSDVFRHWLTSTKDITLERPDIDSVEITVLGKEADRDAYFHSEAFKVNPAMCARLALHLFVVDPKARFAFEQFEDEPKLAPYQSDDEDMAEYYDVMYDEFGNIRSTEKMRHALSAKKSTPGSVGFFGRDKVTPSTLLKSGRSSGLGLDSGAKFSGFRIPEDPEDDLDVPDNYDHIVGSELDFDMMQGAPRRRRTTTPSHPSLLETEEEAFQGDITPREIGRDSMNLLQFLSRAVFTTEKSDTEMESVSLTDLCTLNHLNREKAARLFYQTLVLVGADYLAAYQDQSVPFDDITLIPGPRFEYAAGV